MTLRSAPLTLDMARGFPAGRPRVFELCSNAAQLARWWGPKGFSVPSVDFEPRVGSSYRIEMQPPEGAAFHLTGEFRAVVPPTRLAYTFRWEEPDPDDVETVADLAFQDVGEGTEVRLTQGPFKTGDRRELHRNGWTESFDRLEALLSSGT